MFGFEWADLVWIVPGVAAAALFSLAVGVSSAAAWDWAAARRRKLRRSVIHPEILRDLKPPATPRPRNDR